MDPKKNSNQEEQAQWLPLGLCMGVALGTALGSATGNMALWMSLGLSLGVAIGVAIGLGLDAAKKKNAPAEETEKKDEGTEPEE